MFRAYKKSRLSHTLLRSLERPLGFVDVGSGGLLKHPWSLLPSQYVRKFDIDPELSGDQRPLCISDHNGEADFHIAIDPRSSSLHRPSEAFMGRYGSQAMRVARVIRVELRTLSEAMGHLYNVVDLMDINVEGHDAQVLKGARRLFESNFIKLVKVEYELTEAWHDQGWFADIDTIMRGMGYELAAMTNDLCKPVSVSRLRAPGEPIWGKASYTPSLTKWRERAGRAPAAVFRDDCLVGICLYTLFDLPARALDVSTIAEGCKATKPELTAVPGYSSVYGLLKSVYGTAWQQELLSGLSRMLPDNLRERLRPLALRFFKV
jgi:FkbM family methyltransferase